MSFLLSFLTRTKHLRALLIVTVIFLAAGCASKPTVSSKWVDKDLSSAPYTRVLVVGVSKNSDRRLSFEESVAEDLRSAEVEAWPSVRFMKIVQEPDEPIVRVIAEQQQADSIVVTRVTKMEITPVEIGGRSTVMAEQQQSGFDHTYSRKQGTLFRYDYEEDVEDTYMTTEYTTELHTDVYDVQSGKLVYSINSAVAKQETLDDVIKVLSDEIAKRLRRDKVIAK